MEQMKTWAMAVCVAALVCTAVQMLVPKNGLGKAFRIVLSAAFLLSMIQPIANGISVDFPPWQTDRQHDQTALDTTLEEQLCRQVESAVRAYCEQQGISVKKVETVTDISPKGSIYMKHILIYTDKQTADKAVVVKRYLEQDTSITVEVIAEDTAS